MNAFEWKDWNSGKLPELERHSEAKLTVLRDYVTDYICILCSDSYGRDAFRITMVDGFAGGGAYGGGKYASRHSCSIRFTKIELGKQFF